MIYGSVCSGLEAATVAWGPLGWTPAWFSEIDPFCCRILKHHYPHVPNLGNMLKIRDNEIFKQSVIDLLIGGTPCQDFSMAGLRAGLTGKNGSLAVEFCRILMSKRPRWFIWENVPGVFSSGGGADFHQILMGFQECGYSCAWRVLDSQYFGVPQRRRRVFVVGHLGDDWRPSAAVLFEPQGLRRYSAPRGKKGQTVAALTSNGVGASGADDNQAQAGHLITMSTGQPGAEINYDLAPTLNCDHEQPIVVAVYDGQQITSPQNGTTINAGDPAPTMSKKSVLYSIMPMNGGKDYKAREAAVTQPLTSQIGITDQGGDVILQPIIFRQNQRNELRLMGGHGNIAGSLTAHPGAKQQNFVTQPIAFQSSQSGVREDDVYSTLDANNGSRRQNGIITGDLMIRRLTPLECERLQGFPDGYTALPKAKDTPRYESLGNSMATDVIEWLGRRIEYVDKQLQP